MNNKKLLNTTWPDCGAAKVNGQQTPQHLKGHINMSMRMKFEENTAYSFLDNIWTRQTDRQTN